MINNHQITLDEYEKMTKPLDREIEVIPDNVIEDTLRNLKSIMEKHKNDTVNKSDINISQMCKVIIDYLERRS